MASQMVFLLDLDAVVSLGEEEGTLRRSMMALLRSESRCSPGHGHKSDLPSFAVRFYSSSGFFGHSQEEEELSYELKDLSHDSLESLERLLDERLSSLLCSFRAEDLKSHLASKGTPGAVEPLSSSLDLLMRHYSWDRPLLFSPLKKSRRHSSLENAVYVVTSLPKNKADYKASFNKKASSYTVKELSDRLLTRHVQEVLRQEQVALVFLDIAPQRQCHVIKDLFLKALKQTEGGVRLLDAQIKGMQRHPLMTRLKLGGTNIPALCIPCQDSNSGGEEKTLQLIGIAPGELFAQEFNWVAHYSLRVSLPAQEAAMGKRRVLLFRFQDNHLAVLFNCSSLSVLPPKDSQFYLSLFEEKGQSKSPPASKATLLKTVDDCFDKEGGMREEALPSGPLNRFSDVDLETWRLGEAQYKNKKKKNASEWKQVLKSLYGRKERNAHREKKLQRRGSSSLMERSDSGFSEGRRSSASSLTRRLSDESMGVRTRRGGPMVSRAAELLRLGNAKNAEARRRRSQVTAKSCEPFSFPFNDQRASKRNAYEAAMSGCCFQEKPELLARLMEFQVECVNEGDAVSMSALAEITISSLLKHLTLVGEEKANLMKHVCKNFLVDPLTISRRMTTQKMAKRLRDHKLQVLYRMELHWLLPTSEEQEKFENEILIHLRQISIWGSPEEMASFLNEALTPMYVDRQPELLCSLYDELNQPKADVLRGIFSPSAKSDCSSVAPSSVVSQSSEASQYSSKNPSLRSHNRSVAHPRKLRRPNILDQRQMRQIAQPQLKTTASKLAKKPTYNIKEQIPSVLASAVTASPSSKGRAGLHRAKRNLSFDGLGKSPKKRKPSTPRKKPQEDTPKKKPTTPKRMTPNKTHCIYAPETPKNKALSSRKSDGLITIHESPDIDSLKAAKTTPRRMRASLNLHRKTSFYSGDVSRNLMKAEENVNASKIRRTSSFPTPFLDESSCDSTAGYLFQHIIRKRTRTDEEEEQESRNKIRRVESEDIFSEPSSSPMKTPKKRAPFKTPVKGVGESPKKVQFNMRHQPPTPSRGTPAKTILKTPSKEPKTPTSTSPSNRSSRKKRILFEDSPSRRLVGISRSGGSATKKKIDFEEVEIPDSHLNSIVRMSKATLPQEESPTTRLLSDTPTKALPSREDPCVLQPIQLGNTTQEHQQEEESVPLKRTNRCRKVTQRLGIDDVPLLMGTPSPVRSGLPKGSSKPSSIRKNLFAPETDENAKRRSTTRSRVTTHRLGIDDITLNEVLGNNKTKRAPTKVVSVEEPLETIVDGFGPSEGSPVKNWSVTGITESPMGEIKLKINRTPSAVTQRISRSLVSEIGVSPDRLRQILTESPSPKKTAASSSAVKYSPLSSMSLIQLTTSPILDKSKNPRPRNRKVNKRLYID